MGRTGTLISIDAALAQAAREGIVNIPAIVTKTRTERMKMVQSPVSKITTLDHSYMEQYHRTRCLLLHGSARFVIVWG